MSLQLVMVYLTMGCARITNIHQGQFKTIDYDSPDSVAYAAIVDVPHIFKECQ
jgi:hypothetical protein